jgi:hypothetical protein
VAFLAVLAVQVGVPLARLTRPRQARFGWQMFSTAGPAPLLVAVRAGGARDTLDVGRFFAFRRGDLPRDAYAGLPAHACARTPGARAVLLSWPGDSAPAAIVPCR